MINPKLSAYEDFGPIQISARISDEPYEEGKYAPHLHIKAYHTNRKKVVITGCVGEDIEMEVPRKFKRADMETFISICGKEILEWLRKHLDEERKNLPEPLTYDSKVPYFGKYVPIRVLPDNNGIGYFENNAVHLQAGLSGDEIRNAVLDLFGDMAYGILKKRLDHYAEIMGVQYGRLEIDDGRRGWGSYNMDTRVIFMSRRLMMVSQATIDSLIIHELAHGKVFEHNEGFHNEVLQVMPDYDDVDEAFLDAASELFEKGWI